MSNPNHAARPDLRDESPHWLIYALTAAAVLFGLWGRFKGLGAAPLSADEYYIARSVEDILRTGLPEFDCGGYYTRGLLFQYTLALLQMAGMSPEFSARFVAAISSVLVLPAVYLLGRRVHSPSAGLLAVAVLAISAWQIDIARFGRMYAPFQAVFAWYLVYFVRYTVDGDRRALPKMLLLSVVGVFTWEGGVMLALTNLLPPLIRSPEGRFSLNDVRYLVLCGLFLVTAYFATFTNFRHLGVDPFPPGFDAGAFFEGLEESSPGGAPLNKKTGDAGLPLIKSPLGVGVGVVLLMLSAWSLRWPWSLRHRWPAAIGLTVALVGALAHQFAMFIFIVAILMLARVLAPRDLVAREARPYFVTFVAAIIGWTSVAFTSPDWLATLQVPWGDAAVPSRIAYEFLKFPDFLGVVALPLARADPILGAVLFIALAVATLHCIVRNDNSVTAGQVLLLVVVCLLAVSSLGNPPRFATRYVVFLFPIVVLIAVSITLRAFSQFQLTPLVKSAVAVSLIALTYSLTGDFHLRQLFRADYPTDSFRRAEKEEKSNILRRSDPRGAAEWLAAHATSPKSLKINAYPSVDFYFRNFDFAYIGPGNHRYWTYACQRGTVERWGNLPLLYSASGLREQIARHEQSFIVIDTPSSNELLEALGDWLPRVVWQSADGYITIVAVNTRPTGASQQSPDHS